MYTRVFKPFIDFVTAASFCILFSWLFVGIIIAYKVCGFRNIIFRQQRVGLLEKPFTLFKFRTLLEDEALPLMKRQFWLGSILRRTSLDEVPQLINVLRGEMSLVGPRPLPLQYLPLFNKLQRQRHLVRPGITGLVQTSGRTNIAWQEKFNLDIQYVEHVSLWLDLKIIFRTIVLLLSFKTDMSLKEKPFSGNP